MEIEVKLGIIIVYCNEWKLKLNGVLLQFMNEWNMNEWKLKLNCNKTKVLVFSKATQNLSMSLNFVVKTLKHKYL